MKGNKKKKDLNVLYRSSSVRGKAEMQQRTEGQKIETDNNSDYCFNLYHNVGKRFLNSMVKKRTNKNS